ncbi:MAG: hypothetical protein QM680_12170 [Luteolibacter sp.]
MPDIPEEIYRAMLPFLKSAGIDLGIAPEGTDLPDEPPVIPAVNLNRAVSEIAHETGMNLKTSGLYLYGNRLVTITEEGKDEEMDVDTFRTWIDQFQLNYSKHKMVASEDGGQKKGPPIKTTMKRDVASVLLKSGEFRGHLPEIKRILPMRLPVFCTKEDGMTGVRLLDEGYDFESKVYTHSAGVVAELDWTVERAKKYLEDLLKDFPFADVGRSLSVQISGMMTIYCQLLFPELDRWPMIYFNANNPGSGKSRLAEIMIYPVYGEVDMIAFAENDEFVKRLDSWAQKGIAYCFIDDVSGLVKSNELNRWLTSPRWSGRLMHSQKMFSVINQLLTLLTGNQATLSDDLGRRSLMIDLWSGLLAADRQSDLSKVIDQQWLVEPRNRIDILSAMHALLRNWVDEGAAPHKKLIPSFEGWSRMIPAMVTLAGFECPLQPAKVNDAGQKQEVEFKRLIEAAVAEYQPEIGKPVDIRLPEWCRMARSKGLFHTVIADVETAREMLDTKPSLYKLVKVGEHELMPNTEEQKHEQACRFMDKSMSTKFGGQLHKFYRGRICKIDDRFYRFADRESKHSTYVLEQMRPEDVR